MTQIRDQVYEQTLEVMQSKFPELVGTEPQWPRFDHFKQVYTSMDASRIQLEQAIAANHFRNTVVMLCEMITSLQAIAISMGVDTRPIIEAMHHKAIEGSEIDITLIVDDLLEFQGRIRATPRPELVAD